ncbi:aminotransferase class I/II-fold pyridoxal phosphate-dependent enzyme [Microbulbifer hydrolyticus]|uniref:Aminotransferase class V-fold PLP-dependent enzyme n=1 Tax=Microbulbifer hydrolyticus TaxID=48074 RepID=A0A6P1T7Q4_9GAMM|nr:aminotransferase class I/II-fold pyridoxal phosphate-dependent enzyme [Microbulbifer hydrolyticus]MBB5210757.1 arginine decarboxylase [Microbulbifer hydrolyticus]QHQ38798.1 aminotransferase class V-fold PLP-dependent enzyme [Microbulbifer hydrolyticus]
MKKSPCEIVLLTADSGFANRWVSELGPLAEHDTGAPVSLTFSYTDGDGLTGTLQRGTVQILVVDDCGLSASDVASTMAAARQQRAEVDAVLLTGADEASGKGFECVISRGESNYGVVYRTLRRIILERIATPFADALREYVYAARDSWHTPGHSSGDSLSTSPWIADFYRFMGEHIFNTDLSVSVKMLDSLMDPISVIRQAQQLTAKTFGARHSYFVTNGTSTSNKIVLQHLLRHGDRVIVDRNCHKSVHHAMIMSGALPVYLESAVNQHYGIYGPVPRQQIFSAIDANPGARLLVLTSCTYDGLRYDLRPIIEYAHRAGLFVLIDEAWYAHGRFHPELRPTALECGADFVTQSTHKMLSAFSQASMIHVGDFSWRQSGHGEADDRSCFALGTGTGVSDFDAAGFREDINMHTSTSPQYGMIASLDVARKQMSIEGYTVLDRTLGFAEEIRGFVDQCTAFRSLGVADLCDTVLAQDGIRLDPTKVTIDVGCAGLSAPSAQARLFTGFGIQVEKNTHNTLSFLVTIGTTESKVLRLKQALRQLSQEAPGRSEGASTDAVTGAADMHGQELPALSDIVALPRTAYFSRGEKLSWHGVGREALVGRVACDEVVPYPPGIPLLVPGQVITAEILDSIIAFTSERADLEMHGLRQVGATPALRVLTKAEAAAAAMEFQALFESASSNPPLSPRGTSASCVLDNAQEAL